MDIHKPSLNLLSFSFLLLFLLLFRLSFFDILFSCFFFFAFFLSLVSSVLIAKQVSSLLSLRFRCSVFDDHDVDDADYGFYYAYTFYQIHKCIFCSNVGYYVERLHTYMHTYVYSRQKRSKHTPIRLFFFFLYRMCID